MKDNEIIILFERRDEYAIQVLSDKYHPYCYKIAWNLLANKEDSEECLNDTWFSVWSLIPPKKPSVLSHFCGRITRNLSIDRLRKKYADRRPDLHMADILGEMDQLSVTYTIEDQLAEKEFGNIDPKYISEAEGEWKGKKKTWTPSFWSKLAAACVILALISTVLSNPKVQAAIKNLALSIGETLGFQKEIESYTEILNMSQTDHGITANIKEVVLDEGVLLFRVHAEIDNSEKNEQEGAADISSFKNTGITLDMDKTTINGQKLDEYMNGEYSPYSVDDLLDADADSDEKEYDRVQEYRFHAPTDLGENPEVHLVLNAFDYDDWEKSVAEFTYDFNISREKILKQTTNRELENISVETEEGTVTLKDIFLNKLQSSISADVPEKLFQKYDVELRGTDSRGNKVRYELKDDAETGAANRIWKFKTNFWRTYGSAGDDERPEIPDPDSEYLELQLYLKSDDIMEGSVTKEYDLDDDTYAEEEGKVYDAADDSAWKAVGEKIWINIK